MKKHFKHIAAVVFAITICLVAGPDLQGAKDKDPWEQWLEEVDPIITRMERGVANMLKTEEERTRFKEMFWKARDTNPETPVNEYRQEFYQRVFYAREYLNGVKSDRGRIYVLLGKPENKTNFVGNSQLVELELWSYEGKDRPGLMPFMNFIFFKPRDLGDFQLYHPGIHKPTDLLAPQYTYGSTPQGNLRAFRDLKMISGELARASLSIIPGEGDPRIAMSMSSSSYALNRVYTLPEREAESGYIRNFLSPTGRVEVSYSTNAVRGFGYIAVTRNKGIPFVHYALVPDVLNLKKSSKDLFFAEIHLHISIEDMKGNIVFQNRRRIDLKIDPAKKQKIDNQRIVFRDFAPIIEGDFNIVTTFINKTTQEFFTCNNHIRVGDNTLSAAVGFQLKEVDMKGYVPFAADRYLVLTDPRFTFNQKDALEGIVMTSGAEPPEIFLEKINLEKTIDKNYTVNILPQLPGTGQQGSEKIKVYKFRQPLAEVKDGSYWLTIKDSTGQVLTQKVHVLPFYIDVSRPFAIEKPESAAAANNYIFVQAQQYLETRQLDRAIQYFNKIPPGLWNAASLPIIARAYYMKGDYAKVVELLEKEEVKKEYPTLLMLANSAIELRDHPRSLKYLEEIRKYGDTPEINQLIASTYLSMGNREKAVAYYERARKLINKNTPQQNENKDQQKENNHE
jgi:GWxTD domain-containing protein